MTEIKKEPKGKRAKNKELGYLTILVQTKEGTISYKERTLKLERG